jgi:preprotein translocase subunit SecD
MVGVGALVGVGVGVVVGGIGVLVSMFSAITVTRTFLFAFGSEKNTRMIKYLFGSGVN